MEIADSRVVTVHFTLIDENGQTYASTQGHQPLVHLQGSGGIIPALEQALAGRKKGDRFEVEVDPEHGFGPHFPTLVQAVPRARFRGSREPEIGDRLTAQTRMGTGQVTVTGIDDQAIAIDGNHPLAGKSFRLQVEVVDVRLPRPDEIQFGAS